jgi:hypothetical protein
MSHVPPTSFTHNTVDNKSTSNAAFCSTSDPQTLAVYVGPQKIGFVRAAHAAKFQALDLNRRVIGVFDDVHTAMRACWGAR